jgi:hypothetical protein
MLDLHAHVPSGLDDGHGTLWPGRMLKTAKNRLLALGAQKGLRVFAGTYRAATARKR